MVGPLLVFAIFIEFVAKGVAALLLKIHDIEWGISGRIFNIFPGWYLVLVFYIALGALTRAIPAFDFYGNLAQAL